MAKIFDKTFGKNGLTSKTIAKEMSCGLGEPRKKKIKQLLTEGPCLAHYAKDKDSIITTDASTTRLGITVRQKQVDGNRKPIPYESGI